mmetsp:Transcript_88060/g.284332  ORF Transcript_88060/g.284332 Transcript_88060/m.284332 type:complete len:286 (+) Transcript_88060:273-1130(+)
MFFLAVSGDKVGLTSLWRLPESCTHLVRSLYLRLRQDDSGVGLSRCNKMLQQRVWQKLRSLLQLRTCILFDADGRVIARLFFLGLLPSFGTLLLHTLLHDCATKRCVRERSRSASVAALLPSFGTLLLRTLLHEILPALLFIIVLTVLLCTQYSLNHALGQLRLRFHRIHLRRYPKLWLIWLLWWQRSQLHFRGLFGYHFLPAGIVICNNGTSYSRSRSIDSASRRLRRLHSRSSSTRLRKSSSSSSNRSWPCNADCAGSASASWVDNGCQKALVMQHGHESRAR